MAYPFAKMPTLKEFINSAKAQGWEERVADRIVQGHKGPTRARYLIRSEPGTPIAILPEIDDDERLAPTVLSNLVRLLGIDGYDHCVL